MSKKFVFTPTEDGILIENVQRNTVIFDTFHPKYKDTPFKDNIWTDISEQVGRTVNDCKKRWRNIRDTYMKQRKKKSISRCVAGALRRRNWPTTSHLSFLDGVERNAAIKFEGPQMENFKTVTAILESTPSTVERVEDDDDEQTEPTEQSTSAGSPSASGGEKTIRSEKDEMSAFLAKWTKRVDDILTSIANAQNQSLARNLSDQHREDEVDMFFKSIAMSVKKLPRQVVNEAKLNILTLVARLDEEYREIK